MKAIAVAVALAWLAPRPAEACKRAPPCAAIAAVSEADAKAVLAAAKLDRTRLVPALHALTRSDAKLVGKALARADVAQLLAGSNVRCELDPILRALAANDPDGFYAVVALFGAWTTPDLVDALVRASGAMTVTPEVGKFWDAHLRTDRATLVAAAMAENRTSQQSAIELHKMLVDRSYPVERRIAWLRTFVLANRDRFEIILAAAAIHKQGVEPRLRIAAAEVMFDFRGAWYDTCGGPALPALSTYSLKARVSLRGFAHQVMQSTAKDKDLETAIAGMMKQLDKIEGR